MKKNLTNNKISLINHYEGDIIKDNNKSQNQYVIDYIIDLYKTEGRTMYDKKISQLEHTFQTMEMGIKLDNNEDFHLCCS